MSGFFLAAKRSFLAATLLIGGGIFIGAFFAIGSAALNGRNFSIDLFRPDWGRILFAWLLAFLGGLVAEVWKKRLTMPYDEK